MHCRVDAPRANPTRAILNFFFLKNWRDLDFYEQKFQETEKFHVRKVKYLVRATERKMSVWRMETSDDHHKHPLGKPPIDRCRKKEIQLKICFLNNFLNRCKSLPAYISLDIYITPKRLKQPSWATRRLWSYTAQNVPNIPAICSYTGD